MTTLTIWTDGSYRPSANVGGIGVVVVQGNVVTHKISKGFYDTTNNQMEITAIMTALDYLQEHPVDFATIYSDSQYCLGIINDGWKRSKNVELWKEFDNVRAAAEKVCPAIWFRYTKGHADDQFNNLADELATTASNKLKDDVISNQAKTISGANNLIQTSMLIALDFDGTVVKHRYPEIGESIGAEAVLQTLQQNGHQFILYTMRDNHSSGRNCLKEASDWFAKRHINLIGINCNPWQKSWTDSTKVYAPMYIDDAALGAPLKRDAPDARPYIDWKACVDMFAEMGLLSDEQAVKLRTMFL